MESNGQTEQARDRLIKNRMTAKGWRRLQGGGIEQKGKRTQGHGQQCGDCRQGGGERGVRGLKSNRKNTMKILKKV